MPIIDLVCTNSSCATVDSTFLPASQCGAAHPESEVGICSKCSSPSERNYSGGSPSIGFLVPPVVHYNRTTGQYSIPGSRDDEVDKGYEKIEIRDMRAYAKLARDVNAHELDKARYAQEAERQFFDARLKEQREERKRLVETAVSKGGYWAEWKDEHDHVHREWRPVTRRALGLHAASIKYADKSIDQRRKRVASNGPNFHSRLLEHNESERSVVTGAGKKAVFLMNRKG